MASLIVAAPAKLNLFLHITGKRADGYHLLESLVVFTAFGDRLEITPAQELSLEIRGPFAPSLSPGEENIILKAARALQRHSGAKAGAHIVLHKEIPVGAGLGGGSSDAAAALKGLMQLWRLPIEDKVLQKLALQLGCDVPVCLFRRPAYMRGVGEEITPVAIKTPAWLVLVNPGIPLATADVFRHFSGNFTPISNLPERIGSLGELIDTISPRHNVLEAAAKKLQPAIADVIAAIASTPGCRLSRMSGSGATCFGIYKTEREAQAAAQEISQRHPAWWCTATGVQHG